MVTVNKSKIRIEGSPGCVGFQYAAGKMGSNARLTASSPRCNIACVFGFKYRVEKCAYKYPASSEV